MRKRVADEILDVAETLLRAQLDAMQDLRQGKGLERVKPEDNFQSERKSQISIASEVLRSAGHPLHVNDIIEAVQERQGVSLDRDSLVSAITKKVRRGEIFVRTGPNTFGLREEARKP